MQKVICLDPGDCSKVEVGNGLYAIVDKEDYDRVIQFNWRAYPRRYTYYVQRGYREKYYFHGIEKAGQTKTQFLHNFIMDAIGIDHINGDGLDNRKSNLRIVTQHQNNGNYKKRKGQSKYKGVCRNTPAMNWKAQIRKGDKKYYLGAFKNEEDAAKAYDEAAREYFGENAALNFPHEGEGRTNENDQGNST